MSDNDDLFRPAPDQVAVSWDQVEKNCANQTNQVAPERRPYFRTQESVDRQLEQDAKKGKKIEKEDPQIIAMRRKKVKEFIDKRPEARRMTIKKLQESPIIAITDALMAEMKRMAEQQMQEARLLGAGPRWADPNKNPYADPDHIDPDQIRTVEEGCMGELAQRESFGKKDIKYELPIALAGPDHKWDLKIKGDNEAIEVKSIVWHGYKLDLDWRVDVPVALVDKPVDYYAFALVDLQNKQVALVGFIPRNEFLEIAILRRKGESIEAFTRQSDDYVCEIRCLIPESEFRKPMSQVFGGGD